jgi:hypothetical protein
MAEVIHFTPRAELDAGANLRGFIDVCRTRLTAFGKHLPFDEDVWDVTAALDLKAKNGASRLVFSTWDTVNDAAPSSMPEPFLSFAKAFMRYQHALRPTKGVGQRLAALRALEAALSENSPGTPPTAASPQTLHRAAQLVKEKYSGGVAYRVGGQLELVAAFLADHHLLAAPTQWRNPIGRPRDSVRVGHEFDAQRRTKLPSPAALDALAKVFRLASEPVDVLVSSVAAILCSAPDRINEVLHLEVDCEVTQVVPSSGAAAYGLRWRPSKGADAMVKWVVPSLADVVRQAVTNIRRLTQAARDVAKWYEENPRRLYLPPHLEHLRSRHRLSMLELAEILFAEPVGRHTSHDWCRRHGVLVEATMGRRSVAFTDAQDAILALLPRGFPVANAERGLNFGNALCLIQRNALHRGKATYRCAIDLLEHGDIASRLGARSATGIASIFDRFEFREDDGRPIRVRSHQFRHYLNTLAQAGGLSQLDIAKWSGRKDVGQNKVYDHQSDRDVLALVRDVVGAERRMFGPLTKVHKATLIPRDEFARLKVPTAHTTEFGYSIHDFSMLPCQIHRDCINCDEHVCIKGDEAREAHIRRHREETRALLGEAQAAHAEGDAGANRWIDHQQTTLSRLNQLCTVLDDPRIPIGAVIQPTGVVPASRLEQAAGQRRLMQAKTDSLIDEAPPALPPATFASTETEVSA